MYHGVNYTDFPLRRTSLVELYFYFWGRQLFEISHSSVGHHGVFLDKAVFEKLFMVEASCNCNVVGVQLL